MTFDSPLTVRLKNGMMVTKADWNLILTDDSRSKRVVAQLLPVSTPFILWQGAAYDAIGDYTQAQAETRLREILGEDPAAALTTPAPPVVLPPGVTQTPRPSAPTT